MQRVVLYPSGEGIFVDDSPLDSGGESDFFLHRGRALVLIRNPEPYAEKLTTLRALGLKSPGRMRPAVAFPEELVISGGRVLGHAAYYCRDTLSLEELFTPLRQERFPDWTYAHSVRVARNLALVVTWLVDRQILPLDLSANNVRVARDAWITLIDVASFQVQHAEVIYPCLATTPDITPPEVLTSSTGLAGEGNWCRVAFSLAVLVFRCLFEGAHPYDGVLNRRMFGAFPPDVAERISRGLYPHGRSSLLGRLTRVYKAPAIRPDVAAIPFSAVSDALQDAFEQAFVVGHDDPEKRPTPLQWAQLLADFESTLTRCTAHPKHRFYEKLPQCLWCDRRRRFGDERYD